MYAVCMLSSSQTQASLPTATKRDRQDENENGYLQAPTPRRKVELATGAPSPAKWVLHG